ncbi:MAG: methylase [Bacteroidaceae bacterium]|nr:methylase [Bacteroidaceae bacterium]
MRKQSEIRRGAKTFVEKWAGKGKESQDDQTFWEDLLEDVFGIPRSRNEIEVQRPVKFEGTTKAIDVYVKTSKVVIEQKSHNINLDLKDRQSDGEILTPMEQGVRYFEKMDKPDTGRYVIACNFQEFRIWDSYNKNAPQRRIPLKDLPKRWKEILFLIEPYNEEPKQKDEKHEKRVSITASEYVRDLYKALLAVNKNDSTEVLQSLNVFCVRVVFCLYAEDAGVFDDAQFSTFLEKSSSDDLGERFTALFQWLDTDEKEREKSATLVEKTIRQFPYVNGGLFKNKKEYKTPVIDKNVRNHLLRAWNLVVKETKEKFTWDEISPTNFGCIFESTVAKDVRDSGGMHYTTPTNIHRVIDPLFLDDLTAELEEILQLPTETKKECDTQYGKLEAYRKKLASLRFLDPACGSGNFLTEIYKSLHELELKAIVQEFGRNYFIRTETTDPCKVSINQFFGIEIDHFAASVARTSLWIAACQLLQEAEKVLHSSLDPLPLEKNDNILCADALRTDWGNLVKRRATYPTYIISNPPFQGYSKMTRGQRASIQVAMPNKIGKDKVWDNQGKMDFVSGWYAKAAEYMQGKSNVKCALVSTNSITQGEQVALLWKPLVKYYKLHISFAWRTFRWNNEADDMAHVHCVIIGFDKQKKSAKCRIYQENAPTVEAGHINGYLMDAEDIFIESRTKPLGNVSEMMKGSIPVDGGNLIIEKDDYLDFIKQEPSAEKYVRRLMGAREFLHNEDRFCLWIPDNVSADELEEMPLVKKRIKATKDFRLNSKKEATVEFADYAYKFMEIRQPNIEYILVPRHSSENRKYIPMGFIEPSVICSDANLIIPTSSKWLFGIMQSRIHMIWVKYVCGRLELRFRYSANIVYNNFPWKELDEEQKSAIEETATEILEARREDASCLASQYDLLKGRLAKAHKANDKVVAKAYGIDLNMSDEEIALELMRRSVKMAMLKTKRKKKRRVFPKKEMKRAEKETGMENLPFREQEKDFT